MNEHSNSVNFYEGYLAIAKKERSGGKQAKLLTAVLPLALIALVLLAVAGKLLLDNRAKQERLDALDAQITELNSAFEAADARALRLSEAQTVYDTLSANRVMFNMFPALKRDTLVQVRKCAVGFNISNVSFDESSGVLGIHASSASVNEVPEFVQRLRATELFSQVQYTGYVSDRDQVYYCDIGCTLEPDVVDAEGDIDAEEPAEEEPIEDADDEAAQG